MGRPIILSNGALAVGLGQHGQVHDFYYPFVGLDNLTTARSVCHKIGVWVDGHFSWVIDSEWSIDIDIQNDALISEITMTNPDHGIQLVFNDFVDSKIDLFGRCVKVKNLDDKPKEVKLFMHQVFQISRAGRADTALFDPDEHYILDYKGQISLLIYGQHSDGRPFDQFSVGNYGIEGKEGTFRDAEDGKLSGCLVEHGGVDSVIGFDLQLDSSAEASIDYWIIAGESTYHIEKHHKKIKQEGLLSRYNLTKSSWNQWLEPVSKHINDFPTEHRSQIYKSLMVIRAHTDKRGGVIAALDSSIYNYGRDYYSYVWPRDGCFAMWPLIKFGIYDEPKAWLRFCEQIITPEGFMMHKYQPDKSVGSTWHPLKYRDHKELAIQEDESAIIIYLIGQYLKYSEDIDFVKSLYPTLVRPIANFIKDFVDSETGLPHASFDLWEEKFLTSSYTSALVYASLITASNIAKYLGHDDEMQTWKAAAEQIKKNATRFYNPHKKIINKGFILYEGQITDDETADISNLFAATHFGFFDDKEYVDGTYEYFKQNLFDQTPSGGSPRYEDDYYFRTDPNSKGNIWLISTFWIAQYFTSKGLTKEADNILAWSLAKRRPGTGMWPEQINPETSEHTGVSPLVWTHSEYLLTILAQLESKKHIR